MPELRNMPALEASRYTCEDKYTRILDGVESDSDSEYDDVLIEAYSFRIREDDFRFSCSDLGNSFKNCMTILKDCWSNFDEFSEWALEERVFY